MNYVYALYVCQSIPSRAEMGENRGLGTYSLEKYLELHCQKHRKMPPYKTGDLLKVHVTAIRIPQS